MANILLGVTGSVAAIKVPELFAELTALGHQVRIVTTQKAKYFFDNAPFIAQKSLIDDAAEWPGREDGRQYQRGDMVLHIELRKWADLFLIAPLDANTLAKIANGICDSCLTSVYRCWDLTRPVVIAPAMNTLMWEHPVTDRNLKQLQQDCKILRICWPQEKLLACGDMGTGAMASIPEILSQCYLDQKNS